MTVKCQWTDSRQKRMFMQWLSHKHTHHVLSTRWEQRISSWKRYGWQIRQFWRFHTSVWQSTDWLSLFIGKDFTVTRNGLFRTAKRYISWRHTACSAQQQKPFSSLISTSLPCKTPAKNGCLRFFHSYFKAVTHVRFPVSQFYSVKNFYCVKCIFIHQKEWIYNSEWI